MSRKRAGHGSTRFHVGKKSVHLIQNDAGDWITTGEARGWPRCSRCRRPFEQPAMSEEPTVCPVCFFYKMLPVDLFWTLHNEGMPLAPYNIGRRCMAKMDTLRKLWSKNGEPHINWKRILRP